MSEDSGDILKSLSERKVLSFTIVPQTGLLHGRYLKPIDIDLTKILKNLSPGEKERFYDMWRREKDHFGLNEDKFSLFESFLKMWCRYQTT